MMFNSIKVTIEHIDTIINLRLALLKRLDELSSPQEEQLMEKTDSPTWGCYTKRKCRHYFNIQLPNQAAFLFNKRGRLV